MGKGSGFRTTQSPVGSSKEILSKALGSHGEALSRAGSHRMNGLVGRIIAPKVAIVLNLDPVNKVPYTVSRDE